jgi:DNA N-6-adenine-methyltransferase (Dam)/Resolvase, N terminal domain
MVTRLDRLARSTRDLLNTLAAVKAGFRSLGDTWDTTTAHGRLMLTVLQGLAALSNYGFSAFRLVNFTVDVCATPENAKCERFYTKSENGLVQTWTGTCWFNPPYGKTIGLWLSKAREAALAGATVVALIPARTDTKWWHGIVTAASEIRYLPGRLRFGGCKHSAPFPSAVAIWRPSPPAGQGRPARPPPTIVPRYHPSTRKVLRPATSSTNTTDRIISARTLLAECVLGSLSNRPVRMKREAATTISARPLKMRARPP